MSNTAIILCAGRSTRYGTNKLAEKFDGHTLPYRAAEFALANGATQIALTLSRKSVITDGSRVYHPLVDELQPLCKPMICFQSEETYGAGAAINAWSGVFSGPIWVLFGDNYYSGKLPPEVTARMYDPKVTSLWFTFMRRSVHPRNLQLAAVVDGYVIEKPHSLLDGNFFCGFVRMPSGHINSLGRLKKSDRGEVEVADIINFAKERESFDLAGLGIQWGDLTYEQDFDSIMALVHERQ